MKHPFEVLAPEYDKLLASMVVTRGDELHHVVSTRSHPTPSLVDLVDAGHYDVGCKTTGVPIAWAAASFEREASSDFRLSPAQGDPWNKPSINVPAGLGPYHSWIEAQIAAYRIDGLDKIVSWPWARALYEGEVFNGFGPRDHGCHTGYLWAGTNVYGGGKYVRDGVWDPRAMDQQLGIVPIMRMICELRPRLAEQLASALPADAAAKIDPPAPVPHGHHDAADLQAALNKLGADPQISVSGNWGRETRRAVLAFQAKARIHVDGVAGDETWDAISAALGPATKPAA